MSTGAGSADGAEGATRPARRGPRGGPRRKDRRVRCESRRVGPPDARWPRSRRSCCACSRVSARWSVAFSGGVRLEPSACGRAVEACGDSGGAGGKVLAVTASSPTYPRRKLENARRIAALVGAETGA